ncbi:unnamed protein product [Pleuronectes platessa]|uniref:Uncharacterized protein n=1 Tax=Pleuronectes platessa TaxID=8262 RepID=A0A9N7UW10_PLEPL|nr:unnamed protein product [Pleuronectes platessa]
MARYFFTDEEISSQVKLFDCAPAPRSFLQPPLLMLTCCLHHTKQQTWSDRTFSRVAPSFWNPPLQNTICVVFKVLFA